MNRAAMIVTLACAFGLGLALAGPPGRAVLVFEPLEPSYASFEDITPTLVNAGTASVFFPRHSQTAAAFLQRWDPDREVWEDGNRSPRCGTGFVGLKPLELRVGQKLKTYVEWRASVDNRSDGPVFSLGEFSSQPVAGRYRLVVEFAGEAADAEAGPLHWMKAFSAEFDIRAPQTPRKRP